MMEAYAPALKWFPLVARLTGSGPGQVHRRCPDPSMSGTFELATNSGPQLRHENVRICYNAKAGCSAMPGEANPVAKPRSGINDSHLPLADEFRYISGMGHLLGYARVSTAGDQDVALQHHALTAAGCYRVFVDTASGALDARPALTEVLDQLRPEDTLVVWRLDRLGRSIRHLIDFLADLETRGIGFRSLTESIDTTSPGGRLVFHLFAALAQFERELIKERTNAGLAAARARGVSP